jgi:hypothetical protein
MAAVKETELWQRLQLHLGAGYFRVWAAEYSLAALGQRTVVEALARRSAMQDHLARSMDCAVSYPGATAERCGCISGLGVSSAVRTNVR